MAPLGIAKQSPSLVTRANRRCVLAGQTENWKQRSAPYIPWRADAPMPCQIRRAARNRGTPGRRTNLTIFDHLTSTGHGREVPPDRTMKPPDESLSTPMRLTCKHKRSIGRQDRTVTQPLWLQSSTPRHPQPCSAPRSVGSKLRSLPRRFGLPPRCPTPSISAPSNMGMRRSTPLRPG
jgi:hypothetical protein